MSKILLRSILLIIFLSLTTLSGCMPSSLTNSQVMKEGPEHLNADANIPNLYQSAVPDWMYESVKSKFPSTGMEIQRENITMVQARLKDDAKPQIAAFITLDHLNGVFILYEYQDGVYREVYSKAEPIYSIQVFGGGKQFIAFTSGFGGTGMQENIFHLISYTSTGYREIWTGTAEKILFGGPLPYSRVIGSINISMDGEYLLYSKYKEIYNVQNAEIGKPDHIEKDSSIYIYSHEKDEFIPSE